MVTPPPVVLPGGTWSFAEPMVCVCFLGMKEAGRGACVPRSRLFFGQSRWWPSFQQLRRWNASHKLIYLAGALGGGGGGGKLGIAPLRLFRLLLGQKQFEAQASLAVLLVGKLRQGLKGPRFVDGELAEHLAVQLHVRLRTQTQEASKRPANTTVSPAAKAWRR